MYHLNLLFFLLLSSGALAITKNITVSAAAPASANAGVLEFTPSNVWSFNTRPGATTTESYASTTRENATIVFNITGTCAFIPIYFRFQRSIC